MSNTARKPVFVVLIAAMIGAPGFAEKDIRDLSQHFIKPNDNISPWIFFPENNVKILNTIDHPGLLTIEGAGKAEDIKGILKNPIRLDDYPLPWEFSLGFLSPELKGTGNQLNYAFGVNLAVTFSDPSTWPEDRTQVPPETHSAQLLVTRVGHYGEPNMPGVPQFKYSDLNFGDPTPEVYLLYGRGNLAENIIGDWEIPYVWFGYQPPGPGQVGACTDWAWVKYGGPAEVHGLQDSRFRIRVVSPTRLEIGFGYGQRTGWRMRTIDVSELGPITGIWEIGPIISLDSWMKDELAPQIDIHPSPVIEPPHPELRYFIDHAVFFGNGPENLEHVSDDFDIPGAPIDHKWICIVNGTLETWSNPGYLTATFAGRFGWPFGLTPMTEALIDGNPVQHMIDLSRFKPPMEFEVAFIAPDDTIPWNFWYSIPLIDDKGAGHTWSPGIQNIPGKGRVYINLHSSDPFKIEKNLEVNVEFPQEPPQSLLASKPLRLLVQVLDDSHIRVGLKGKESDPWFFSEQFDTTNAFGHIKKFPPPSLVSYPAQDGARVGNYPRHQQFLIDYIRYRYGLSE